MKMQAVGSVASTSDKEQHFESMQRNGLTKLSMTNGEDSKFSPKDFHSFSVYGWIMQFFIAMVLISICSASSLNNSNYLCSHSK